ncbi:uncharacterized protein si:dkeyp-97b10.3 isoform X2 [Electrophorus electricus]|uniref:uncharacterized protein si:dkeyp-97b10.3 isoform X2 n=1 Tax=Electrophorus electricus TaxID=8005 RepID=UPI0015D03139|nr:uncharacterized protein si:dkeyp-97b10.3 isoform X2 [Electrophorus electricus]
MANFGHTKEIEGGNGDIPPSDLTGNELENDVSSPDSTESSSDETSDEGERTDPENGKSCSERLSLDTEASTGDHMKQHCEKCEVLQRPSYEVVTPRKISRDRMLFGGYLSESWTFAGPIFDVDCDPSILKSIQFPHSLCLADQDSEMKFSVLHVKDQRGLIEPSVDHSRSHIKWSVSSLSPVGPIVQATKPAEHHGVVLVYKEVGQQDSYSFRVYFATNNHSDIKDIQKELRNSKKRYMKMEKPPTCQRLLGENRKYRLLSEPQGDITPEDIQFTLAVVKMKGYFEVFFEQCPPFKLSLIEADSEQTVWAATIRAGDCTVHAVDKTQKRSESRKRSNSTSEEELTNKRARCNDESDGARAPRSADLSDKQLMQVAKVLGKEWKSMAICYLDLTNQDLEEIEASEEDLHMRKFRTLDRWRRRQAKGDAGVEQLHNKLDHEDVPNEVVDVLKGMRELS